jgi:hypothetical protein
VTPEDFERAGELTPDELKEWLVTVAEYGWHKGFRAGLEAAAQLPLNIEGAWQPDTVYGPNVLVYRDGQQWMCLSRTASEPTAENRLWRLVHFPKIEEPK